MANFSETPLMEITLRRYESPHNLNERETLKKICLSLGLLQPGDSRDIIVDILLVLEKAKGDRIELSASEIKDQLIDIRKSNELSLNGTADSNIRRQLKRLRDIFLVEKVKNKYRTLEFMNLKDIFEQKIKKILLDAILLRNNEYFKFYNKFEKSLDEKVEDNKNQVQDNNEKITSNDKIDVKEGGNKNE